MNVKSPLFRVHTAIAAALEGRVAYVEMTDWSTLVAVARLHANVEIDPVTHSVRLPGAGTVLAGHVQQPADDAAGVAERSAISARRAVAYALEGHDVVCVAPAPAFAALFWQTLVAVAREADAAIAVAPSFRRIDFSSGGSLALTDTMPEPLTQDLHVNAMPKHDAQDRERAVRDEFLEWLMERSPDLYLARKTSDALGRTVAEKIVGDQARRLLLARFELETGRWEG